MKKAKVPKPVTLKDLKYEATLIYTMLENYHMIIKSMNQLNGVLADIDKRLKKLEK